MQPVTIGARAGYEEVETVGPMNTGPKVMAESRLSTPYAVALLVMVQLSFACNGLLGRVYMAKGTNPIVLSFFRDVSAAAIMMAIARCGGSWRTPHGRGDVLGIAAVGVLGISLSQVLVLLALKFLQAATVSLFQLLIAVLTPFMAAAFGYESLWQGPVKTIYRLLGLATCVLGAGATIVAHGAGGGNLTGSAVLTIQVLAGASYAVMMKSRLTAGWPPLPLVAWSYAVGSLGLLPVLPLVPAEDWILSRGACGVLVYSILMTSVFNYIAMAIVNQQLGATMVTAFYPLQPVFTALGQPLFGMEPPWPADGLGGLVVLSGLALFLWAESMPALGHKSGSPTVRSEGKR